jgi:adenylosuccinate lyase
VKEEGGGNDLLTRLGSDDRIPFTLEELEAMVSDYSQFTGRAEKQTEEFLEEVVSPLLKESEAKMTKVDASLNV